MPSLFRSRVLPLTVMLGLIASACGGQTVEVGEGDAAEAPAAADDAAAEQTDAEAQASLRVGIFVDNAFGDRDFFDQAGAAEPQLEERFGADVTTYEGQLQAQNFEPLLNDAGQANELVFVLGFEAIDALIRAAEANPDTIYVFIDAPIDDPNVVSALFRTSDGCFMAGALAAAFTTLPGVEDIDPDNATVGFVGGVDAPVVTRCLAGFEQGASHVNGDAQVLSQYVGSFVDPAKGKEINVSLAERGADVTFQYAGLSGEGAFDAAKDGTPIHVIGVVADKSYLAPGRVPGSLLMNVDAVILDIAQQHLDGSLQKGELFEYGFADGGWGMVYDDALLPDDVRAELEQLEADLSAGRIDVEDPLDA